MHPHNRHVRPRTGARAVLAMAALLMVGIAGCASEPTRNHPPADAAPYVGVFTGEFVDGKPLYRLPAIEVVGSPSSIEPRT